MHDPASAQPANRAAGSRRTHRSARRNQPRRAGVTGARTAPRRAFSLSIPVTQSHAVTRRRQTPDLGPVQHGRSAGGHSRFSAAVRVDPAAQPAEGSAMPDPARRMRHRKRVLPHGSGHRLSSGRRSSSRSNKCHTYAEACRVSHRCLTTVRRIRRPAMNLDLVRSRALLQIQPPARKARLESSSVSTRSFYAIHRTYKRLPRNLHNIADVPSCPVTGVAAYGDCETYPEEAVRRSHTDQVVCRCPARGERSRRPLAAIARARISGFVHVSDRRWTILTPMGGQSPLSRRAWQAGCLFRSFRA